MAIGVDCSTHHISMGILGGDFRCALVRELGVPSRGTKAGDRLEPLMVKLDQFIETLPGNLRVYVEDVPVVYRGGMSVNKAALVDLAQVTGGVTALFARRMIPVELVNNQSWKAYFGFGHREVKTQIAAYVDVAWTQDPKRGVREFPGWGARLGSDDLSQDLCDAICIAEYGRTLHADQS